MASKTWKITYIPKVMNGGIRGVAIVEADTRQWAIYTFQKIYSHHRYLYTTLLKLRPAVHTAGLYYLLNYISSTSAAT